jgi:hypothetical protein
MKRLLAIATILTATWTASGAADGGGGSPGVDVGRGVVAHNGGMRYVTVPTGRTTLAEAVTVRGGRVVRWRSLRGFYGVPLVTYDGATGGLAHNGRRLVLASLPVGTPVLTRFVVLDPRTFKVRTRLVLRGNFAYDAISPGGSLMYLIQYLGPPTASGQRYAVRALNLNTRRLYPGAIVDRREPDEKMTGIPLTRTESRDGKWAYTLYSRTSKSPFVHALDTSGRRAFCVDLPWRSSPRWVGSVRMRVSADGGRLVLFTGRKTRAIVDTKTFEVSRS